MKIAFIAVNVLLLLVVYSLFIPQRLFVLRGQQATVNLRQQQLSTMEENYRRREDNALFLSQLGEGRQQIIIQPAGHMGAMLTELRGILHSYGLTEVDFHASEHTSHYTGAGFTSETRAQISAEGAFDDLVKFIRALDAHYRYLRIIRLQTEDERFTLSFAIYEELRIEQ